MEKVNLKHARQHLSHLVEAAERGESVIITRRGKEAARLAPVEAESARRLPDLRAFRASFRTRGKRSSSTVAALRSKERY